jgi:hypothetical protein
MTDKSVANLMPELASISDELILNFKGSSAVTDDALPHLLQAKDTLKSVNLVGTKVTADGVKMLRRALPDIEIVVGESQPLTGTWKAVGMQAPKLSSEAVSAAVSSGEKGAAASAETVARTPLRPFDGYKFPPNPDGFKFRAKGITDGALNAYVGRFAQYGGQDKMHFNLSGSPLTDKGLTHLLPLGDRLATVNLTGTRVTETGINALRKRMPQLEVIMTK